MSRLEEILLEIGRLLGQAAVEIGGEADFASESFQPRLDVMDAGSHLEVLVDLPGIPAENLDLSIGPDSLILEGHKQYGSPARDRRPHHHRLERSQGRFARKIVLPGPLDSSSAEATLSNGLLAIRIPRLEERRETTRRIAIRRPKPSSR